MAETTDFIPVDDFEFLDPETMIQRSRDQYQILKTRHSIRDFANTQIPREVIENCLKAAGTAPNGANKQPWHFAVVTSPEIKRKIRLAAEAEEREFYQSRAPEEWLKVLEPLGTNAEKPFLETAPVLIVIFRQDFGIDNQGETSKHYYVRESVGIATGMLIDSLHRSGLATLTHTPSPMKFLAEILNRPKNERAEMILVVGLPTQDAKRPNISKKSLDEIATWH